MRYLVWLLFVFPVFAQEHAPNNELAFQLGGLTSLSRGANANQLDLSSGLAMEANYARRLFEPRNLAVYAEVHFLANPQRTVASNLSTTTRDVASLYVTPGVRVKFAPLARISPYLVAGGGLAWYEQSKLERNGVPNAAPRETYQGAFGFGGGADVRVRSWLAFRGEIRDFYTGSPSYNLAGLTGGQHNPVIGGGFVIRWR